MVQITINGITIKFPYKPYPAQIASMSALIKAFKSNTSSLIESPTGTGKSLAIICAVLGYLENEKEKRPKIFICSRTHKQLDQLVEQLKKTNYTPKISILGSRNQYCINTRVKNAADKNAACKEAVNKKECIFKGGVGRLKSFFVEKVFDLEELKSKGKKCAGCPYFAARELAEDAEVIFAPYNYLIDPNIRKSLDIKLEDSVVIIDEAHNIEDTCRSSGSLEISSKSIDILCTEASTAARHAVILEDFKQDFLSLRDFLFLFRAAAEEIKCSEKNFEFSFVLFRDKQIVGQLEKMGISQPRFALLKASLQRIRSNEQAKSLMSSSLDQTFDSLEFVLGMIFYSSSREYVLCFKRQNKEYIGYSYCFWLLDPSLVFRTVSASARSVNLLSGTLSPFSALTTELKSPFPSKIVAPHILKEHQVFIASVFMGHRNKELCGTYAISETFEYLDQVARIVQEVAATVSTAGGTLVFLPSYAFLKKLKDRMKTSVLVEPSSGGNEEFERVLLKYKRGLLDSSRAAIMLCVYRGKAAEGIDFKDSFARAVIAVGIPYPSVRDPQIKVKREFNDRYSENSTNTGSFWYGAQAMRAVNQALGRVVRHPKDWGTVYLVDSRYRHSGIKKQLPDWVTNNLKEYNTFENSKGDLKEFIECKTSMNEEESNI
ncbi:RAD3-like DNA-binding helicase [Nucleospora cyclopteri]